MYNIIKKTIFLLPVLTLLGSCNDKLDLESKTSVTYNYLKSTPDGLARSVVGLYDLDRGISSNYDHNLYVITMCDYNTDIMVFRAGTSANVARLKPLLPDNPDIETFWTHHYSIIGKANEIIANAEDLGLGNETVKEAWAEAKFFRGRSYFELWKRFDNLYLNNEPTTKDNLVRDFHPASEQEMLNQITSDLDDAIEEIDWQIPNSEYGRVTKAVAKHVRAQIAMWQKDYDRAIKECEDVINSGYYKLLPTAGEVFEGPDLRNSEVLWSYQFSQNPGGGGTGNPLMGHRISLITTTRYQSNAGCTFSVDQGGYGWGRVYPNTYLLSLYGPKDNRNNGLFVHDFYYNDPKSSYYGGVIPKNLYGSSSGYLERLHFMSKKFMDKWTNKDQPDRTSSFRDLIVYRLAETYLMCAEAYYHRDGGSSPQAVKYYNATWTRAGNDPISSLTLDMLIDEYARELNFEGVRWPLLKRLSKLGYNNEGKYAGKDQMVDRVRDHYGETKKENPYLEKDYIENREFLENKANEPKLKAWPIPQAQIDLAGGTFPQNDAWK